MQKPTLLGVEGEAERIIKKYNAGVCYEPENEEDFLKKVYSLKNDKELYSSLQKGCIRLADDFNRERLARKMLNILFSVQSDAQSAKQHVPNEQVIPKPIGV